MSTTWHAFCQVSDCGWAGRERTSKAVAEDDGAEHVLAMARANEGPRSPRHQHAFDVRNIERDVRDRAMKIAEKTPQLCYAASHAEKSLKFVWSNGEHVVMRCASRDDLLKVMNAVNGNLRTRVARDIRPGH